MRLEHLLSGEPVAFDGKIPEGIYSKDGRIGFSNGFSFHFTLLFFFDWFLRSICCFFVVYLIKGRDFTEIFMTYAPDIFPGFFTGTDRSFSLLGVFPGRGCRPWHSIESHSSVG